VIEADGNVRLDLLVSSRAELSRTQAATLIANGNVTVNGRREKASYRPVTGDTVVVDEPAVTVREITAESIPL
jgi:23S rRNA pseudouridine1911/1915/1917 synthase